MVTLVNRNSASASEIVSGALQDHDRSLIVGETTFGKALVQSVYRVSQNAGAAITTARYYTPSGRLIQRPWDGSFDEYLTYTLREQDANKAHRAEDLKLTDARPQGLQRRRRRAGQPLRRPGRRASTRRGSAARSTRRNLFDTFAQRFSRRGDTRIAPSATAARAGAGLRGDRRDGRRVQGARAEVAGQVGRSRLAEGSWSSSRR